MKVFAASAKREVFEECGLQVELEPRGEIRCTFEDNPDAIVATLFAAATFSGLPVETEEMHPQWFAFGDIPYDHMWPDDQYWLPLVLADKSVRGQFHFSDSSTLLSHDVQEL